MRTAWVTLSTVLLLAGLVMASLGGQAGARSGPAAAITGDWWRSDGALRINVAPCGDRLCAVNTWTRDTGGSHAVGDRLVMTVQPREPETLAGEAFDERRGMTYSLLISIGRDAMTTRGCLLAGVVCRTMSWTRPPKA